MDLFLSDQIKFYFKHAPSFQVKFRFVFYLSVLFLVLSSTHAMAWPFNFRTDPQENLLNAIGAGDVKKVKELLSQKDLQPAFDFKKVNSKTAKKDTLLSFAARKGNAEIVRLILKSAPDPDFQVKEDGTTPLYIAAQEGHIEVVKALLSSGAKPDLAMTDGATPLLIAAENGHVEGVKALLSAGAKSNLALTGGGVTPLYISAQNGHLEVVKALLLAGAEPDLAMTDGGATPLYVASKEGNVEVVKALLAGGAKPDLAMTDGGATPLSIASKEGNVEVVRALLLGGAKPDLAMAGGATPLYIADHYKQSNIFDELLKSGRLNLNQEIKVAIQFGNTRLVNRLKAIRELRVAQCKKKHMKSEKGISILAKNLENIAEADLIQKVKQCYNIILVKKALLKSREQKNKQVQQFETQLHQLKEKDGSSSLEKQKALKAQLEKTKTELSNLESDTQCPLCMDCLFEKGKIISPSCGHLHCKDCFKRLFISSSESNPAAASDPVCPLCRGELCGKTSLEILTQFNSPDSPQSENEECLSEEIVSGRSVKEGASGTSDPHSSSSPAPTSGASHQSWDAR